MGILHSRRSPADRAPRRRGGSPWWERPREGDERIVLHVGCGKPNPRALHETFRSPQWRELRLDLDPDPALRTDIVASIVDMSPVGSETVDAVWSSHNLEHVFVHEVPLVLAEFRRVLRPGGFALVTVPNLQYVASALAKGRLEDPLFETEAGPITPLDMLYGNTRWISEGNEFMAHRTGFTARTMTQKLRDAGFDEVNVRQAGDQLVARAARAAGGRSLASGAA